MIKITNKYIANYLDKQINTVNTWKKRNPKLLNLCRLGAFCVRNGLDMHKLEKLMKIKNILQESNTDIVISYQELLESFDYNWDTNIAQDLSTGVQYELRELDDNADMVQLVEILEKTKVDVKRIQGKLNNFKSK